MRSPRQRPTTETAGDRRRPLRLALLLLASELAGAADPGATARFLVFDLEGDGFYLTDRSYAICFDADGDGAREMLTWTASGRGDAFLWRDADGDRLVDHGGELIASFEELASLDATSAGGDGDGRLTAGDRGWAALVLWSDRDHDGRAGKGEAVPLGAHVAAITLGVRAVGELDGSLNLHRRSVTFQPTGGPDAEPRGCREVAFRVVGAC